MQRSWDRKSCGEFERAERKISVPKKQTTEKITKNKSREVSNSRTAKKVVAMCGEEEETPVRIYRKLYYKESIVKILMELRHRNEWN